MPIVGQSEEFRQVHHRLGRRKGFAAQPVSNAGLRDWHFRDHDHMQVKLGDRLAGHVHQSAEVKPETTLQGVVVNLFSLSRRHGAKFYPRCHSLKS